MSSYKDTFEPNVFESRTFACGALRGRAAVALAIGIVCFCSESISKPSFASESLVQPSYATESLIQPSFSDLALAQPSFGSEGIIKPSFASEAMENC